MYKYFGIFLLCTLPIIISIGCGGLDENNSKLGGRIEGRIDTSALQSQPESADPYVLDNSEDGLLEVTLPDTLEKRIDGGRVWYSFYLSPEGERLGTSVFSLGLVDSTGASVVKWRDPTFPQRARHPESAYPDEVASHLPWLLQRAEQIRFRRNKDAPATDTTRVLVAVLLKSSGNGNEDR